MSRARESSDRNWTIAISFAAGATTASLFACFLLRKRDAKQNGPSIEQQQQQHYWPLVEEIKSRIIAPEISRLRWPWEKIRTNTTPGTNVEATDAEIFKSPVKLQDKTGLCIGCIFGMDVGGSLAKLVYFEERQMEHQPQRHEDDPLYQLRRRTSTDDIWDIRQQISQQKQDDLLLLNQAKRHPSMPNVVKTKVWTKSNTIDGSTTPSTTTTTTATTMKTSRSMFDLSKSHAEALGQFYHFARTFDTSPSGALKDSHLSFYSRELGGDFHFIQFETRDMVSAMDLIRSHNLHLNIREMGATGGGAHKFANVWERVLGIEIIKQEELDSLVAGMQFVLSTVVGECYTFRPRIRDMPSADTTNDGTKIKTEEESSDHDKENKDEYHGDDWWWSRKVQRDVVSVSETYPYLLVTIGTGVSILRVDGPREHERISGSTIGGGTYWGLIRLLTDIDDFEAVMKLAERGDPSKVDMMVGDIYGKNSDALEKIGLPSNLVASSFGKLVAKQNPAIGLKQEDLARALLLMVTNNIGQVAYLNAKLHKTPRIYFIGNFLRGNKLSQRRLSYAINYWSKGEMEALFLEHEGYFGALGAFLLSQDISHGENGFFQWDRAQQSPKEPATPTEPSNEPFTPKQTNTHRRSKTTG